MKVQVNYCPHRVYNNMKKTPKIARRKLYAQIQFTACAHV